MAETVVCVAIVTYNSVRYIRNCLEAVLSQRETALDVVVFDNASTDGTRAVLAGFEGRIRTVLSPRNVGFAAGQNRAIASSDAPWALTLNPDVLLEPDFIAELLRAAGSDASVGSVCGRLRSIGPGFVPLLEPRIDSTGIYFTPSMRHFDRGWREPDDGRYPRQEYVFGATAAAALYRRAMIEDISLNGDFFDPDFFAYREDADVAWRAQLLGWRCVYTPRALGWHVRTVVPENRRSLPPAINMHSVKNRFLMRIKNTTPGLLRRYWLPMTLRDLVVVGGCLLSEPASLPAFWRVARCWRRALRARREIMRRRRVSDEALVPWFEGTVPAVSPRPRLGAALVTRAGSSPPPAQW